MTAGLPAIAYRPGDDNGVLRLMLFEQWGRRCYWCREPKVFHDIEIDHIVPRTVASDRLRELITSLGLPPGFHVHDPGNLAPICRPCNQSKHARDWLGKPRLISELSRAGENAAAVIRRVQDHATANAVAHHLTAALMADVNTPDAQRAFVAHGPAIVQTLALLNSDAADFTTVRQVRVTRGGHAVAVPLTLTGRGRIAQAIVEEVCGGKFTAAVKQGITEVFAQIAARVQGWYERQHDDTYDIGPLVTDVPPVVGVRCFDFVRKGGDVAVSFGGSLFDEFSTVIRGPGDEDFDPEDLVRGVEVHASFRLTGRWGMAAERPLRVVTRLEECVIEPDWPIDAGADEDTGRVPRPPSG